LRGAALKQRKDRIIYPMRPQPCAVRSANPRKDDFLIAGISAIRSYMNRMFSRSGA
jgi:hypothetical protein